MKLRIFIIIMIVLLLSLVNATEYNGTLNTGLNDNSLSIQQNDDQQTTATQQTSGGGSSSSKKTEPAPSETEQQDNILTIDEVKEGTTTEEIAEKGQAVEETVMKQRSYLTLIVLLSLFILSIGAVLFFIYYNRKIKKTKKKIKGRKRHNQKKTIKK